MSSDARFTIEEAREAGERIGIDWATSPSTPSSSASAWTCWNACTRDPETDVTGDDVLVTAKIARAHLNEFPDYYTRLGKMEADAEAAWAERRGT